MIRLEKNRKYLIHIENSNCDTKKYPDLSSAELEITSEDIKDAIVTCGILPVNLNDRVAHIRRKESRFKRHLMNMCLREKQNVYSALNYLEIDKDALMYLDASERAVVSYYIGMIFTKIISRRVFGVEYLVHLKRFNEYYHTKVSEKNNKEPDFIGLDKSENQYSLFEAKGRMRYSSNTLNKAKDQFDSIKDIGGQTPCLKAAIMTTLSSRGHILKAFINDPRGEGEYSIDIRKEDILLNYYEPLVELAEEIRTKTESHKKDDYYETNGVINTRLVIDEEEFEYVIPEDKREMVIEFKKLKEKGKVKEQIFIEKKDKWPYSDNKVGKT